MNQSVLLWGRGQVHHATYTELEHDLSTPLEKRVNPCKGSTICGNCCALRKMEDMCDDAKGNINDDWVYENGYVSTDQNTDSG